MFQLSELKKKIIICFAITIITRANENMNTILYDLTRNTMMILRGLYDDDKKIRKDPHVFRII